MRVAATLSCLAVACASAAPRTAVQAPAPRPEPEPAPLEPPEQPAWPQAPAPFLAEEIVFSQQETTGHVTSSFDVVRADLESDDGVRVLRGLRVIDEIGMLLARPYPPDLDELTIRADRFGPLADAIEEELEWLQQAGPCATAAEVREADAQFKVVQRSRPPSRAQRRHYLGGEIWKRALSCGMVGVKDEVAACFARYKVAGTVMVKVMIAKSGKVASAIATGALAGTPSGACVESAVKTAVFPPSDGLIIQYPFTLN